MIRLALSSTPDTEAGQKPAATEEIDAGRGSPARAMV
jgi:hypothetical protein